MRRVATIAVGAAALFAFALAGGIGQDVGSVVSKWLFGRGSGTVAETLAAAATKANEKLPMMVDEETRLDAVRSDDRSFEYLYTLTNYRADEVDAEQFQRNMRSKLVAAACSTEPVDGLLDLGIGVAYSYYGTDKALIATVTVEKRDCV